MSVQTTPHVNFPGHAREALGFYHSVFGGNIALATYGDIHMLDDGVNPDYIAFGRVDGPTGFSIMGYDVQPSKTYEHGENPFYIYLQGSDGAEIQSLWDGLAASAKQVLIPIAPSPFGPGGLYGMVTDRYGVTWIVPADTAAS